MKVFLTRPNHLLRAPTMAHCYDSRRALPHRERRTTAQPRLNCVLISAPANIRMRRQRTGVRWGESTCGFPTSTLRSVPDFFWHRPASCCYRLDSRWSRGRALQRAFFCCFLKSCVRACESELVTGSPQRGRDYLIQPALLIGWLGGWRAELDWFRAETETFSPTSLSKSTDILFSKPRPKYVYNYVFTLLLLSRQHPHLQYL